MSFARGKERWMERDWVGGNRHSSLSEGESSVVSHVLRSSWRIGRQLGYGEGLCGIIK